MIDTRDERLTAALHDFIGSSPDVEAAAVVSLDGLPLTSVLPPGAEAAHVAAMSAALLALGEQAASALGRGELRQLFVEGQSGFVFLLAAGGRALLAAVTRQAATVGYLFFEARRTAAVIAELLEQPQQVHVPGSGAGEPVQAPEGSPTGDSSDAFDGYGLGMAPSHP